MAKNVAKKTTKKRVKKNVERGQAIHDFNTPELRTFYATRRHMFFA